MGFICNYALAHTSKLTYFTNHLQGLFLKRHSRHISRLNRKSAVSNNVYARVKFRMTYCPTMLVKKIQTLNSFIHFCILCPLCGSQQIYYIRPIMALNTQIIFLQLFSYSYMSCLYLTLSLTQQTQTYRCLNWSGVVGGCLWEGFVKLQFP